MNEHEWLAGRFEEHRAHLRGVAYRMLGSLSEAEDAVQEAWIRLSRSDTREVENLAGWLTTVVARVSLDMLRSRKARSEELLGTDAPEATVAPSTAIDPEQEAVLADSVGLALLVVLETLAPAERLAFVLHDLFAVPFEDIASIVGRTPDAARQLASRARRRVRGASTGSDAELARKRDVVVAFLEALRAADFDGLVAVLDPDVVVRADRTFGLAEARPSEVRGARVWAKGATLYAGGAKLTQPALIDGEVGAIFAPRGRLLRALRFTITDGKITAMEVITDAARLAKMEVGVLEG